MTTTDGPLAKTRNILVALLAASAVYLYGFPSASLPYLSTILLHVAAGALVTVLLALALVRLVRHSSRLAAGGWIALMLGAILGVVLAFTGGARPFNPLIYGHLGVSMLGVVLLLTDYLGRRSWFADWHVPARLGMILLAVIGLSASAWETRDVRWRNLHRIQNPLMPPESQEGEGDGVNGPFFPSSAQTSTGGKLPAKFFMQSEACQRCHSDIFEQWSGSAHRFSSFNNQWYRKSIEYMQEVNGVQSSKWCAGCHDPALLFTGMFDTPVKQLLDKPEAHAGLGCVMCHSLATVKSTMGQGDFTIEYPALAELAASENKVVRTVHDLLVYLNPEPHRRTFMKPFVRAQTADFCSSCHKVHLDTTVNNYRWIRGFNDYDNWQASGISGMGARSFYYPPKSQRCVDCHMPLTESKDAGNVDGKVHSHRFPGANTALPLVNQDAKQLEAVTKFLQDKNLTVDIFGLSPARSARASAFSNSPGELATTFAVGEEGNLGGVANVSADVELAPITAPLNRVEASVRPGETYRVDVVVRTRKVGHFFPGGTVDAFDVWLELQATDDNGQVVFWSGEVEDEGKGPVEKGAHFYRSLQVDEKGNPINKRNAWATRSLVYVRLIPPGAADTVRYRVAIPPNASGKIHLKARLLYRKFAWWNTQFAFAGERAPGSPEATKGYDNAHWVFTGDTSKVSGKVKAIPDVPIITLAEDKVVLNVAPVAAKPITKLDNADWSRWNDYGIGLLLQGDLKAAEAAFLKATEVAPDNPDGWVNIGRVRVQEGSLDGAREVLEKALKLAPNLAKSHFFYSRVLRGEGRYDEALDHLNKVIAQYPKDRVVRNDAGRILFLQKKYAEAVKHFEAALSIDPEDLDAHYNLMLCYNGLGQQERALEHQKRYMRFKADESAQAITGPYRMAHPEDNNERQAIHEHVSAPVTRPKQGGTR